MTKQEQEHFEQEVRDLADARAVDEAHTAAWEAGLQDERDVGEYSKFNRLYQGLYDAAYPEAYASARRETEEIWRQLEEAGVVYDHARVAKRSEGEDCDD